MSMIPIPLTYGPHHDPWGIRRQQRIYPHHAEHLWPAVYPNEFQLLTAMPDLGSLAIQSKPIVGDDGFQVSMEVQHFLPKDITVKTIDNMVVIEGKHEERPDDHGYISRNFSRKYILPKGYDAKDVVSTLSSDGVLTVKVPPPADGKSNERIVHIQHTGPAHLTVKNPKKVEDK